RSKTGEVIIAGTTAPDKEGRIVLPVGGDLFPGTYTVEAEVLIDGNAMNVKTISLPYTVAD
ncbi:MAG: hypothetical protein ACREFO_16400, partial [Acetobacteraceae bacterium]